EAQGELEQLLRQAPRDAATRGGVRELLERARAEGVRLPPHARLFPERLRRFEYRHAPPDVRSPSAGGAAAGGVAGAASAQLGECAPGRERNLVVFLHGFGGRKGAFAALAEQLRLPKTAVLAFDGPEELAPELLDDPPGFYWFDVLGED
ncbi:unnamed protein product, partial [Prorocentrum cordatum]